MTLEDVLNKYPGPVKLRTPFSYNVVVPCFMAALCVYLSLSDEYHAKAVGIVCGGFFVLFAIVNHFRPTTLELTGWGFKTKDYANDEVKCRWSDVSEFSVDRSGRLPRVQYADRNYDRAILGNIRLLAVSYPFSADQMAWLMNEWRERSIA
jgi:hypothetical protein